MNANDRRKIQREYSRVNGKFTKKHYPKVFKAVNTLVSSLIEDIKRVGVREATANLSITLVNEKLVSPIQALYREVGLFHAKQNYRAIRAEVGQKMGRNELWIAEIIQYLNRNLLQFATFRVTETLRENLLKILSEGIDKGLSENDIVKLIQENNIAVSQSQRIVRTEINRAANTGILVSANSFDYQMQKEWIAHRDFRTRGLMPNDKKDHYHMDGQIVELGQKFTEPLTGEQIDHPSAPGGSAGMVINCRCTYAVIPKRDENGRLIKKSNIRPLEIKEDDMKETLTEIRDEIKGLAELLKPVDLSPLLENVSAENRNEIKGVEQSIRSVKEELKEDLNERLNQVREELQSSLHNINRVNARAKELTDTELKDEVSVLSEKFSSVEKTLSEVNYSPKIEVKTDSVQVRGEIATMRTEIVSGLNELKVLLAKKRNYSIQFNRDKDGLLISPIKVINE